MEKRRLGDTVVSALGVGGAQWSLSAMRDDDRSEALLLRALETGVTYVDTATAYTTASTTSHNEKLIARVLDRFRGDVIVGTKGGHYRSGASWPIDGTPRAIRAHCEASLMALRTSSLDLFYLHKPDPKVPFEESVGTLEELRREGKVQRTGVSNVSEDQFDAALAITPLSAVQNGFSPFAPVGESLMRKCADLSIAYFVYSPLGGPDRPRALAAAMPRTGEVARLKGLSLECAVLSWELSVSPALIPVIGATRPATLDDSLTASALLADDDVRSAVAHDLAM